MDFDAWKRRPGPASLSQLLQAVEPRVDRICRRILRDAHDAEEARQEVLLEIASGLESVADETHFDRWVGKIAFRTALDRRRMRLRRIAREHEAAGRLPNGAGRDDALHEAMSRLDESDRELLIERYFDRRSLREIASHRGISAVAVRKRIGKAQGRLKRMLGGGIMSIAGASLVKAKTAAAIAVILIPLFILSGGVWVATAKRAASIADVAAVSISKHEAVLPLPGPAAPKAPEEVSVLEGPLDRARLRAEIVACWERLTFASWRSAECKRIWPEATTQEEYLRLFNEKTALDKEVQELHKRLPELAARDPATLIDIVRNSRDVPGRLRLIGLIVPDVEAEIASESDSSGPLLSSLLTLAAGDPEEKTYLAALAARLKRANFELGRVLIAFLGDPDFHVRIHAAQSLSALASEGVLLGFLKEQIPALRQAALRDVERLDINLRGRALIALASIGADEADDFILQQLETAERRNDFDRVYAAVLAGPRLAARHEARLTMAILRALDLATEPGMYYTLLQLAESLPEPSRATVMQAAAGRKPESPLGGVPRVLLSGTRKYYQAPRRRLTGVDRWELNPVVSEPSLKRSEW